MNVHRADSQKSWGVIILAAGLGKRMRSPLPKVLHEIGGKPLIYHVLEQVRVVLPQAAIAIVVGHEREAVESYIHQEMRQDGSFQKMNIQFVIQSEQKGTGHAARCAMNSPWGESRIQEQASILVLPGDLPLVSETLLREMTGPLKKNEPFRLLSCKLEDPTGYGRIVRRGLKGGVLRIVEEKDANAKEKQITEVNSSVYLFKASFLKNALGKLSNRNAQNEYYLTDVVQNAIRSGKKAADLIWKNSEELRGVNDPWELAQANSILNQRTLRFWARQGVRVLDPSNIWIDVTVKLEEGITIHPGAILRGRTKIKKDTVIGPRVVLTDVKVEEKVCLKTGTIAEDSTIGVGAQLGPYAHLRPGSIIGSYVKIGNFVELKKTRIQENTSIAHLSYLGDAEVGKNVNIGCGFVTCNFDGRMIDGERKHRTIIEDQVFLGSDCQTIAPVRIGKGAYVASGSTITDDVGPGDLAIARSRQVNKVGYARKLKQDTKVKQDSHLKQDSEGSCAE